MDKLTQRVAEMIHQRECGCADGFDDDNYDLAEQIIAVITEAV